MEYQQFIAVIKKETEALTSEKQLHVALELCQELYFDYQRFYDVYHWGDPDVLMDAISLCNNIPLHAKNLKAVNRMAERVHQIIPDTEDFEEPLGSYALNASAAVAELLQFITDREHNHIDNIILYYIDSIDLKIQHMNVLEETERDHHPLMLKGRSKILALIKAI